MRRSEAYINAGADILFLESPESVEEMPIIAEGFPDTPKLANMVGGGKTPILPDAELKEPGYQIVIHPVYLLGAAVSGMRAALAPLVERGVELNEIADLEDLNMLADFPAVWAFDEYDLL